MVGNGSKTQASAAPPRTLNVQKFAESRASELHTLHSIVASRLTNDFRFQRNKRRRTTGHDNRVAKNRSRKKQKIGVGGGSSSDPSVKDGKKVPRRIRRRIELKKNPVSGYSTSGDGTKRLRTHVWHAKRFTMTKLWGFYLPLGLKGRGRGSRALLKKLKHGVLVHDASYYGAIQLEGPQDLLVSILSAVLVPYPSAYCDRTLQNILSGVTYGRAMLHQSGAPFSQTVAPVTYMWRSQHTNVKSTDQDNDACKEQQTVDSCSSCRQLWIWIHPAAFREGYDVLKSACEQINVSGCPVNCKSLNNELAKLELVGLRAFQLIQKILHPATCTSANSWTLQKSSVAGVDVGTPHENSYILKSEDDFSPAAIISLSVNDPRAFFKKGFAAVSEVKPPSILSSTETEVQGHTNFVSITERTAEPLSEVCIRHEESYRVSEFVDLWDTGKGIIPPVEESVLCEEKHRQRMKFFRLSDKSSATLDPSEEGQFSSHLCPIMLLKSNIGKGSTRRWSIILPLSWVKAFWSTIILNGAQAIGLRERHWIASEVGFPYFPPDFPDSNAYSCFMAMEAATTNKKEELLPPGMKPLRVPIVPPWDCVRSALENRSTMAGDTEIRVVMENSMKKVYCEKCDITAVGSNDTSFDGFVARTPYMLIHFLTHINGDNLLLFPDRPGGKKCLLKVMKDDEMINLRTKGISSQVKCCQKICFLRVLLHSFKEGFFEEGAMVCSPCVDDIRLWTHRCENGGELQVPQSLLSSYFVRHPSGKWELKAPEDPEVREFYRRPIGFVTAGFVRGSKKPSASAICAAILLAHLREEQWKTMPLQHRKKEIYVLVRNLRSTAYRLALATIVLEEQEEDVDYI